MGKAVDEGEDFFRPGLERAVEIGWIKAVDGLEELEDDEVHGGIVKAGVGLLSGARAGPLELAIQGGVMFLGLEPILIAGVAPARDVVVLKLVALFTEPVEDAGVFDVGVEEFVNLRTDGLRQPRDD
jgi:hypothetical protein